MKLRKSAISENGAQLKADLTFDFPDVHDRPHTVLEFYWDDAKWLCYKTPRFLHESYTIPVPMSADLLQIVYRVRGVAIRVDTLRIERDTTQVTVNTYKAVQS